MVVGDDLANAPDVTVQEPRVGDVGYSGTSGHLTRINSQALILDGQQSLPGIAPSTGDLWWPLLVGGTLTTVTAVAIRANLAKRNCAIIDKDTAHQTRAEPFVGMGGIFLQRTTRPHAEVINDFGRDVANLFRILQRTAFGGKVSGRTFGASPDRSRRFNLSTLEPMLQDLHSRLSGVVIKCPDFAEFRFEAVKTTCTIAGEGVLPQRAEVLISNRALS